MNPNIFSVLDVPISHDPVIFLTHIHRLQQPKVQTPINRRLTRCRRQSRLSRCKCYKE